MMETFKEAMDEAARAYLLKLLQAHEGDIRWSAAAAGIHRGTLWKLMRRHRITVDRVPRAIPAGRSEEAISAPQRTMESGGSARVRGT